MSIPNVGKVFATAGAFLDYLDDLKFGAWRPRFVTMHHTGAPDLKTWNGWQTRSRPVTDEQWLINLAKYYGETMGWSSGPHFFFTPKHYCVLSPPERRGVHAVSFNAVSWGVECVGDFDREPFDGDVRERYVAGLAALHIAAGLQLIPFERGVRGLHFHRDDPKTSKTCPGTKVFKGPLVEAIAAQIAHMTAGDHPEEKITPLAAPIRPQSGVVNIEGLNLRAAPSGKAPIIRVLGKNAPVLITDEMKNGETPWFAVTVLGLAGYVAGRFVDKV